MRYPGRILFGDGAADLDILVEVSDTHVRLTSGGESIGSWCLADVVAERLVSDEFSLDLAGEVVRIRAEDQVNFAYGAVQAMAEGWARFHSKHLLTRQRAVAAARRLNEPSRIEEVRQALLRATVDLDEKTAAVAEALAEMAETTESSSATERLGEAIRRARQATAASVPAAPSAMDAATASTPPPTPAPEVPVETPANDGGRGQSAKPRRKPVAVGKLPRLDTLPRKPATPAGPAMEVEATPLAYADGRHPAETSGLRAGLRSIFSRGKEEHEHTYVESTTAVGITRRVCLQCGHVSIGVKE